MKLQITAGDRLGTTSKPYETQLRYDDCRYKNPLPFDFTIKVNGTIVHIEFDGKQHFTSIKAFGDDKGYCFRVIRDWVKNEYCKTKKIKLVRIRYDQAEAIDDILELVIEHPEIFDNRINP
ncbi:MAG: hypothetical protein ABS879_04210 [Eubacteriales bacterium]